MTISKPTNHRPPFRICRDSNELRGDGGRAKSTKGLQRGRVWAVQKQNNEATLTSPEESPLLGVSLRNGAKRVMRKFYRVDGGKRSQRKR